MLVNVSGSETYYTRAGVAITSTTQPNVNGGAAVLVGTNDMLSTVSPAKAYSPTVKAVAGNSQGVISVSVGTGVAATSVAGSVGGTSGYCVFTKASHGLLAGAVLVINGATANSLNTIHVITAKDTNTFTTDVTYEASATAGTYQPLSKVSSIAGQNHILINSITNTILDGSSSALVGGSKYNPSINKIFSIAAPKTATAMAAGKWNFTTGVWSNGYPASSTDTTANSAGTYKTDGSIGTAANPTATASDYITIATPAITTVTLSRTLW